MKALAVLTVLALLLAGCGGKDKLSKAQMEAQVEAALAGLEEEIGPGGSIRGAELSIPVDLGGIVVTLPLQLDVGTAGDVMVTGSFGIPFKPNQKVLVWAYCSPSSIVLITQGLPSVQPDSVDLSVESRNLRGSCTEFDPAVSEFLGGFSGLGDLLVNDGSLELKSIKQPGKKTVEAVYRDHAAGTDITLVVASGRLELVSAAASEGELKIDFLYGERQALAKPLAAEKMPAPVAWRGKASGADYQLDIDSGEAPFSTATIQVYAANTSVGCAPGPVPVVEFSLSQGLTQSKSGIQFQFIDQGDGVVGKGDVAFLRQPAGSDPWKYKVEVWDDWSDTSAHRECYKVPGAPATWVAGLVLALAWGMRRRRDG